MSIKVYASPTYEHTLTHHHHGEDEALLVITLNATLHCRRLSQYHRISCSYIRESKVYLASQEDNARRSMALKRVFARRVVGERDDGLISKI